MAPSKQEVTELFNNMDTQEGQKKFFEHVRDDVNWWIVGSTPMSKTYTSKADFQAATLTVLNSKCFNDPLRLKLVDLTMDGDQAVAELAAIDMVCKNGMPYPMRYCWVLHFDEKAMVDRVRAYLDTELLSKAIADHS